MPNSVLHYQTDAPQGKALRGLLAQIRAHAVKEAWPSSSRATLDEDELPKRPYWQVIAIADKLVALGQNHIAVEIFSLLKQHFPERQASWTGAAKLATMSQNWAEAAVLWRELQQRFSADKPNASWALQQAKALINSDQDEAAMTLAKELLNLDSENANAREILALAHEKRYEFGQAAEIQSLRRGRDCKAHVRTSIRRIRNLARIGLIAQARRELPNVLDQAASISALRMLARISTLLYSVEECSPIVMRFQHALEHLPKSDDTDEQLERADLRMVLHLMIRDHASFLSDYSTLRAEELPAGRFELFGEHAQRLMAPSYPDFHAPRIFGIGLSKTGTTSLHHALMQLGYRSAHYLHPITFQVLCEKDNLLFDAHSDITCSQYFESLYHTFPNAKFVYTTRPAADWVDSMKRHYHRQTGSKSWAESIDRARQNPGPAALIGHALYFRHPDAKTAWHRFDSRVQHFFDDKPADRFLEFNVFRGDGWEQLCRFLGREAPECPFKHENMSPDREPGIYDSKVG